LKKEAKIFHRFGGVDAPPGIAAAAPEAIGEPYEDAANRAAFKAEPPDASDLVGLALRGPKKDVAKATKDSTLHP
jgi:hypothetical protein